MVNTPYIREYNMTVEQISKYQLKRGPKAELPTELAEGELAFTTDTGEVFVGAPRVTAIENRQTFPYQNVKLLTEFDVVHTLHDHIVTTGPLLRVGYPSRGPDTTRTYEFTYTGTPLALDGSGNAIQRSVLLTCTDPQVGDLRGRVIESITFIRGSDSGQIFLNPNCGSIVHTGGPSTPNSELLFDLDATTLQTIVAADEVRVVFFNINDVVAYPLSITDSMVMDYSMLSDTAVTGVYPKRVGTLMIIADEYTVGMVDNGVDINNQPGINYMRLVFSGRIENRLNPDNNNTEPFVVLQCTNLSDYPVSMTFTGARWKHSQDI